MQPSSVICPVDFCRLIFLLFLFILYQGMPSWLKEIWKSHYQLLLKVHQNDKTKITTKYKQLCKITTQQLWFRIVMTPVVVMWKLSLHEGQRKDPTCQKTLWAQPVFCATKGISLLCHGYLYGIQRSPVLCKIEDCRPHPWCLHLWGQSG